MHSCMFLRNWIWERDKINQIKFTVAQSLYTLLWTGFYFLLYNFMVNFLISNGYIYVMASLKEDALDRNNMVFLNIYSRIS